MAEDEIFSFNFEIFNTQIFSLEVVDDIFSSPSIEEDDDILSDAEWETLALAEEKRLAEEQARKDDRITWDELSKFADSNTPQIAEIAREQIAEIDSQTEREEYKNMAWVKANAIEFFNMVNDGTIDEKLLPVSQQNYLAKIRNNEIKIRTESEEDDKDE